MIEIKITSGNVSEMFSELQQLIGGAAPKSGKASPAQDTRTEREPYGKALPGEAVEVETAPEEVTEEKPVEVKKTRKTRSTKKQEAVEEEPKKEKQEEPKQEKQDDPKEEEQEKQEEPKAESGAAKDEPKEEEGSKFPGDFAECADDKEVLNKVRLYIADFNNISPDHVKKAKDIFKQYGVPTLPRLSTEQAMDFYNKLKAEA